MSILIGWVSIAILLSFLVAWVASFFQVEKDERPQYEPWPWRKPKPLAADRVTADNWYERRHRGSVPDCPRTTHVPR